MIQAAIGMDDFLYKLVKDNKNNFNEVTVDLSEIQKTLLNYAPSRGVLTLSSKAALTTLGLANHLMKGYRIILVFLAYYCRAKDTSDASREDALIRRWKSLCASLLKDSFNDTILIIRQLPVGFINANCNAA